MTPAVTALTLTADLVARVTAGRLASGSAARVFESVSTDTRTLKPGALFVALRGPHFDGHAFLAEAWSKGAAGALVETLPARSKASPDGHDPAVIAVPDTLKGLQQIGREVRTMSGARVIAITGSAGKTTTKEVTASLLDARYRVFRSAGNLNNHIGVPLSLAALAGGYDYAVIELGMNHAGELRALIDLARPDVRVWTNVGDAHLGHFASREALADAKAEILEAEGPADVLVVNADDALIRDRAWRWSGRRIMVGEGPEADVRAVRVVDHGVDGTSADVETLSGALALRVPLVGRVQLGNVLAAVAVALDAGITASDIEARVAALRPVARRGDVVALRNGVRLVDDSYNASPAAVRAMLAALGATPGAARRVAIIGEMLELGDGSRALHETCGHAAVENGVDLLVAVGGPAADGLVEGAVAAGLDRADVVRFADSAAAADKVPALLRAGDLVLVKGSRGTRTDVIVDRLRAAIGVA